jgi:DAK2 domain fusion protein YloV
LADLPRRFASMSRGSGLASSDGAPLTVSQVRSLLAAGLGALEERKQEINDLNVYPVPDGDTGTNLALTVRAIVDAVAKLPENLPERELCAAISQAALMGARGNSGVILSQIIRGAMDVLGDAHLITSQTMTMAFRSATDTAYRAVRRPVEGTMLTVLREMAESAARAPMDEGRKPLLDQVVAAGWKSVERTPSLLRVLAEAGVVDAGGYGLVVLIEGAANGRVDWETPIATRVTQARTADDIPDAGGTVEEESEFTYCCSFLLTGDGLDQDALEKKFACFGDSLLVVGGGNQFKVHVHTDDPGQVVSSACSDGILTEIEIDNMKEQTAARTKRLQEAAGGAADTLGDVGLTQVVAVVAGEGNKELFRSLGVDLIVDGGQSMNPSAEDLLRSVESATAPSVIILPNNANVIMTADQTIGLTTREVYVVPSRSIQAGLSAAVAYDKRAAGAENTREMTAAIERVLTGEVTRAVRKSQVDGVKVKVDDFIGLVEDRVVVASPTLDTAVEKVIAQLLDGRREMLTVLLGEGQTGVEAKAAVEQARRRYPRVEVDIHEGGQPFYPILLASE